MCHEPSVAGETGGMLFPIALLIGLENVSVIGVLGLIVVPGAGYAWAEAPEPVGNQLISCGFAVSHVRGTAATHKDPA